MTEQTAKEKDFKAIETQEELDKIVDSRLARERAKYADYEALKAAAVKCEELENSLAALADYEDLKTSAAKSTELESSLSAVTGELEALKKGIEVAAWKKKAKEVYTLSDKADEFIKGDSEEAIMKSARNFSVATGSPSMMARGQYNNDENEKEDPLAEFFKNNVTR